MRQNGHYHHCAGLGEDAEYKYQIKSKYFFRLKINSLSVCLSSMAVLVADAVLSLPLPPLSSLLPSSFVVAAAITIIVVIVFVESSYAASTAVTDAHHIFHSIPIVFC